MSFYAFYPPGSAGSSNASVSTNGTSIPGSSTLVAGENPTGNLQPLQTDASGNLLVSVAAEPGAPIHVIVDSSALPTGAATSANQTNGTQTTQIVQGGNTAVVSAAGAQKVDGSAVTQPISAASLPLPTGASTLAAQTNVQSAPGTPQTTAITVQGNASGISLPVTVTSNTFPQDIITTGSITSTQSVTASINGYSSAGLTISGTWTGTIVLEGSVDGTTYVALSGATLSSGLVTSTFSANNTVQANISGLADIRMRGNTVATGTANITIRLNVTTGAIVIGEPLPNGGNTIGSIGNTSFIATQGTAANLNATVVQATGTNLHTVVDSGTITIVSAVTAITNALPAGTNLLGKTGIDQTTNGTTNAVNVIGNSSSTSANSSLASAALEASHVIKAGAGRLYQLTGVNTKATAQYIQVFNSTTVPSDTTVPVLLAYVPSGAVFSWDFGTIGRYFSTGISVSNSSTAATKTIGSADCWFNAEYL